MSGHNRRKVHGALAFWILGLLAAVPLPLGSNIPIVWTVSATLMGATLALYGVALLLASASPPVGLRSLLAPGILFVIPASYAALQALPLDFAMPFQTSVDGGEIFSHSLSIAPGQSVLVSLQLASYGTLFFLVAQIAFRPRRARLLLSGLFWIIVAYGAFGILALTQMHDTLLGLEKWAYQGSATATFVNRNSFATYLAIGLSCGIALAAEAAGRKERGAAALAAMAPSVVGCAVILAALFATGSRMGLFAGAVGAALVMALWLGRQRGALTWILVAVATLGAVAVGIAFGGGLLERVGSTEAHLAMRFSLYEQVIEMIWDRPLLGFGAGTFETAYPLYHRLPVNIDVIWDKAHSIYLALWTDYGVVVGSLPMLAVALLVVWWSRAWWETRGFSAPLAAGLGATLAVGIHSLVDFSLEIQAVAMTFTAIAAIATGAVFAIRSDKASFERRQAN